MDDADTVVGGMTVNGCLPGECGLEERRNGVSRILGDVAIAIARPKPQFAASQRGDAAVEEQAFGLRSRHVVRVEYRRLHCIIGVGEDCRIRLWYWARPAKLIALRVSLSSFQHERSILCVDNASMKLYKLLRERVNGERKQSRDRAEMDQSTLVRWPPFAREENPFPLANCLVDRAQQQTFSGCGYDGNDGLKVDAVPGEDWMSVVLCQDKHQAQETKS
ncbi:hypothetical protein TruAng_004994 [Truncatella angustata]|nr:hypothetical protein TruAng_004994 [Truncatella angustata]